MNIRLLEMEDRGTPDLFDSLRVKEIYENTARVNKAKSIHTKYIFHNFHGVLIALAYVLFGIE